MATIFQVGKKVKMLNGYEIVHLSRRTVRKPIWSEAVVIEADAAHFLCRVEWVSGKKSNWMNMLDFREV